MLIRITVTLVAGMLVAGMLGACSSAGPGGEGPRGTGVDPANWTPPIGIPAPAFGISEEPPVAPADWSAPVEGFYYVDNTHAAATDAGNPFGTPTQPRQTIPSDLPAGAVVLVSGGPYGGALTIRASGTVDAPVFVRAAVEGERPVVSGSVALSGSYLIVERFDFFGPSSGVRVVVPSDHISVRHNEIHGAVGGGSSLYTGRWNPEDDPAMAEQIVFFDNFIHDNGDVMATFDEDHHGIAVGHHAAHVWIVDNEMARNSGDGLQVNAKKAGLSSTLHHIYAGRNLAYGNKQTGLWTKQAEDVVFSQNEVYDHRPSNSSGGAGIGFQYGPERLWILFNEIHDCEMGITSSTNVGDVDGVAGTGQNVYVVGNLIYDIHKESGAPPNNDPWQAGSGIHFTDQTATKHVVHNTIFDTDVSFTYARGTGPVHLANNLFAASLGTHLRIETAAAAAGSTVRDQLFDPDAAIRWGDNVTHDLASFTAAFAGQCSGCLVGDAAFVNAAGQDFQLTSGSAARDAAGPSDVAATFQSLYGLSIDVDFNATPRTAGAGPDIGCFEFSN